MENAIALTEWFKHETRRIYAMFVESDDERQQRELIDTVARLSDPDVGITGNDLRRRSRQFQTTEEAEAALNRLAKAGLGEWHTPQSNGRPTRYFRLVSVSVSSSRPEENGTLGYGYSIGEENTQTEWATI